MCSIFLQTLNFSTQHSCLPKQGKNHKLVIFLISNCKLCEWSMFRIWSSTLAHHSWKESDGTVMSNFLWKFFICLTQFQRGFDLHTFRQTGLGTYEYAHSAYVWIRHYESMTLIPPWHEPLKWSWSELLTSARDRTKGIWCGCAVPSHGIRTVQCWLLLWRVKPCVACDSSAKVIWRFWLIAVINAHVFFCQNFCLFKSILFCLSLLSAFLSLCFSILYIVWVCSVHILTGPPHNVDLSSEVWATRMSLGCIKPSLQAAGRCTPRKLRRVG